MNKLVPKNLVFYFLILLNMVYAQAQITVSGTNTATTINAATATAVAPDLTVTGGTAITDFTVSIVDSYSPSDVLSYSGTLPPGVVAVPWSTTTRSLVFKGSASAAQWQSFLRTVTVTSGSVCSPETRKISFAAGETYYNPLNGHFYRLTDTQSSWTNSQNTASSTSYYGREGYLVTLTSDAENTFVSRLVGQNSWMGASDDFARINNALGYTAYANQGAAEGKFFWVTGPEKGTQLTTNNGNGNRIPGVYQNWRNGEPNNAGNEAFGHVYTGAGDWNDFANTQNIYGIMEFGDMPNDLTTSAPQFTKDIFIQGSSSGSISGGEVTVCSGSNSTTLTLNGLTGTVVRWERSTNNFITAGTNIPNTTTTLNVSNISETTYYRAVVNSTSPSACNGLVTSSTAIFVSAPSPGNVFAANTTVCAGSNAELYVSGQEGTVQKWQRSADNTNWTDIANTQTTLTENMANTGTLYYRVLVEIVGCGAPVASASKEINIVNGSAPVGGAVSSAVHGSVTNSGSLSLSGHTGTITKWQRSTDDGIIWSDIPNTTTSYSYANVNANTLFRAQLVNGSCGSTFSTVGSVVILDPPFITDFTPSVAGNGDVVSITGSGFTGTTGVSFGASSALDFTVVSDTEITATVGTGASGSISVTNPAGTDAETGFIYKIAQYDFENNVLDATDNNYDGTVINTVSYETGAQGQAICFDNGPGYVRLPDNLIRNLSEFTISLRFKTTTTGAILGYQDVQASTSNTPTYWIPILLITSDGKLKGTLWTGAVTGALNAISANPVNDGNWHQVDFVGDTNRVSIYLDGNLEASESGASVVHLSMIYNQLGFAYTRTYNVGPNTSWEYFEGCIDDLVIIDRALTALEIEEVTALPEPTITSFTPAEAGQGATVTITGTHFEGATQVTFGGVDVASYTVDSATQITAILGSGATGNLAVTTAGGTATASGFTFTLSSFTVSRTNITMDENAGSGSFTVALDNQPLGDVQLDLTSNDTQEATTDVTALTFTPLNWNSPQTVTVTGVNDDVDRDDAATITVAVNDAASDDAFDTLADQEVAITLTDDDTTGFTVSETTLTLGENTGSDTFTIALNSEPISDVVIDISSSDTNEASLNFTQLTFTAANWNSPQTVTVTGVNDDVDRDDAATITVAVNDAASDDAFDTLADQEVAITLTDDDTASYTINAPSLTIDENAGTGTFTIVLGAEPTSDVQFDISSNDTDEATLNFAQLTFTAANWNSPQTVTVTGVNDDVDRDDAATITVAVNDIGSDDKFDTLENQTVAIMLTDEDTDSDGDGIIDTLDNCQITSNTNQLDTDSDGEGDACDTDDDNDGTPDEDDDFPLDENEDTDTDGDGTGDNEDTDDDGDGTPDTEDDFPLDENEDTDTDGDGTGDNEDDDDDNDGTPDAEDDFPLDENEDTDTDGDGTGDNEDTDADGDGTPDTEDDFPLDENEDTDTDGDGTGDNEDDDDDNDGTPDAEDDFPLDENEDTDTDGDGTGDNEDTDDDGDGIPDTEDPDSDKLDTDGDGIPDTEDDDDDNDGTPDAEDAFPKDENEDTDTDGDGTGDNEDEDDDGDGIPDTEDPDSDKLDTDGDGIPDIEDDDDDNDGTPDAEDDFPKDENEDTDTDGDGTGDNEDEDDDGDGIPDTEDPDSAKLDTDGDGVPDIEDNDDDNDGVMDIEDSFPLDASPTLVPAEAFTPNGDGINDTWVVPGIDNHPNNTVRVYNRWGHEVFVAGNYQNDWTGRHNANSTMLPTGSYLYVIDLGNGTAPLQGWIFINY